MPSFGKTSKARLETCDRRLQVLMDEVIKYVDISILCGERTKEEQNAAFASGRSKVEYPKSYHNSSPSLAVDIAPYPIDWDNIQRFKDMNDIVQREAQKLDIDIEWGGYWNSIKDYPHYQVKKVLTPNVNEDQTALINNLKKQITQLQSNNTMLTERIKAKDEELTRAGAKLEQIKEIIIS